MGFTACVTGVSGKASAGRILQHLADWNLSLSQLWEQAYDGAGSMAGKRKGAAKRILELYPKAIYTHCAAHVLNIICVVKCCSIQEVSS